MKKNFNKFYLSRSPGRNGLQGLIAIKQR